MMIRWRDIVFLVSFMAFGDIPAKGQDRKHAVSAVYHFSPGSYGAEIGMGMTLRKPFTGCRDNASYGIIRLNAGYNYFSSAKKFAYLFGEYAGNIRLAGRLRAEYGVGLGLARSFVYDKNYVDASGSEQGQAGAGSYFLMSVLSGKLVYRSCMGKEAMRPFHPFLGFRARPLFPYYRSFLLQFFFMTGVEISIR